MSFTVGDTIKLQKWVRNKQVCSEEDFKKNHLDMYVDSKLKRGFKVSAQVDGDRIRAFFRNSGCRGSKALVAAIAEFKTYEAGAPAYQWLRSPSAQLEEKLMNKWFCCRSDPVDGDNYFCLPNGSEQICKFQPFRDTCALDSLISLLKAARSLDGKFISCDLGALKELTFPEPKSLLESLRLRELVIRDVYPTLFNNVAATAGMRRVSCVSTLRTCIANSKLISSTTTTTCEECGKQEVKEHTFPITDDSGVVFQKRATSCSSCDNQGAIEVQELKSIVMLPSFLETHKQYNTLSCVDISQMTKKSYHRKAFRLAGAILYEEVNNVGHFTSMIRIGTSWMVADDANGTVVTDVQEPIDARLLIYAHVQK